jgi:phosphate starvation-inducible PhoH-like protein
LIKEEKEKNIKFDIQLNEEQKRAKEQILSHPFSFIHGKAGSGKTLLATATATDQLFKKNITKIVITRPTVATEDNGFLPGSIEDKLDPWLVPIKHNLRKFYNKREKWDQLEKDGIVEIVALSHFRGRTFENAICIVDEYQNLNKSQLQMCIGRLGYNSRMIFCGDPNQIDLRSGISAAKEVDKLKDCESVFITELLENHRHPAVMELLTILNA